MLLKINHETRYVYDAPVQYALQQVRLRPKQRPGQEIRNWGIEIDGGQVELSFEDQHCNHVDLISIERGRTDIAIRCTGEVENSDGSGILGSHSGFAPLWYFKGATDLTRPGSQTRKLVKALGDDFESDVAKLHALSAAIINKVAYQTGKTNAETEAETALKAGEGVCQDHSHIFCTAARLLGFPARYVSGYLMMTDRVEQDATHAWAEAHVEGLGWVGFDVSNGYSPDERYVRIATGLDYREASPISGLRFGPGSEDMIVTLQVQQ
ncbi:transglutaminase domain-containing protein [Sphingorhabdus sp. SMR4y]|uniref:transglutaminase family protein n=1 Tax=Sphingorhabdus sp. SMR4y TaxID=2584094 RepID=UPI000B5C5BD8|nr:transglutaminase family protein [Sphingorhabdus sp. SMR4y]ASK87346.1 transglutaminase-like superfamily protein [Sphingorhabdus sp. SMR4y]